jgi:hypothetical protein
MRMRTVGALSALLLVVSGCGGGDDARAKKSISDLLMSSSDSGLGVTRSEADCVAAGFVDDIGVDRLKTYGVLTKDAQAAKTPGDVKMSEGDADAAASAFVDCVDVQQLMLKSFPLDGMDQSVADCVKKQFNDTAIHDFLAAGFRGEDRSSAAPEMLTAAQKCVTG